MIDDDFSVLDDDTFSDASADEPRPGSAAKPDSTKYDSKKYAGSAENADGSSAQTTKRKQKSGPFERLGLSTAVTTAVKRYGFRLPTPIQRRAIPVILQNQGDVIAMARTGSGKTCAFILPLLDRLGCRHSDRVGARGLILSPSRELALQTFHVLVALIARLPDDIETDDSTGESLRGRLRCCHLVGGMSMTKQFEHLADNPDIIVATPGRLHHHLLETGYSLQRCVYVVFDEADRLLEVGFDEEIKGILEELKQHLGNSSASRRNMNRQLICVSATIPSKLMDVFKEHLILPKFIRLDSENELNENLKLQFFFVRTNDKIAALLFWLKHVKPTGAKAIVFCSTRHHINFLHELLNAEHIKNIPIDGSMNQELRTQAMDSFRSRKGSETKDAVDVAGQENSPPETSFIDTIPWSAGKKRRPGEKRPPRRTDISSFTADADILLATDLAARGMDIPGLEYVVHFDWPSSAKIFIHRCGRTARKNDKGTAVALITREDLPFVIELLTFLGVPWRAANSGGDNRPAESGAIEIGGFPSHLDFERASVIGRLSAKDSDFERWYRSMVAANIEFSRHRPPASKMSLKRLATFIESVGGLTKLAESVHSSLAWANVPSFVVKDNGLDAIFGNVSRPSVPKASPLNASHSLTEGSPVKSDANPSRASPTRCSPVTVNLETSAADSRGLPSIDEQQNKLGGSPVKGRPVLAPFEYTVEDSGSGGDEPASEMKRSLVERPSDVETLDPVQTVAVVPSEKCDAKGVETFIAVDMERPIGSPGQGGPTANGTGAAEGPDRAIKACPAAKGEEGPEQSELSEAGPEVIISDDEPASEVRPVKVSRGRVSKKQTESGKKAKRARTTEPKLVKADSPSHPSDGPASSVTEALPEKEPRQPKYQLRNRVIEEPADEAVDRRKAPETSRKRKSRSSGGKAATEKGSDEPSKKFKSNSVGGLQPDGDTQPLGKNMTVCEAPPAKGPPGGVQEPASLQPEVISDSAANPVEISKADKPATCFTMSNVVELAAAALQEAISNRDNTQADQITPSPAPLSSADPLMDGGTLSSTGSSGPLSEPRRSDGKVLSGPGTAEAKASEMSGDAVSQTGAALARRADSGFEITLDSLRSFRPSQSLSSLKWSGIDKEASQAMESAIAERKLLRSLAKKSLNELGAQADSQTATAMTELDALFRPESGPSAQVPFPDATKTADISARDDSTLPSSSFDADSSAGMTEDSKSSSQPSDQASDVSCQRVNQKVQKTGDEKSGKQMSGSPKSGSPMSETQRTGSEAMTGQPGLDGKAKSEKRRGQFVASKISKKSKKAPDFKLGKAIDESGVSLWAAMDDRDLIQKSTMDLVPDDMSTLRKTKKAMKWNPLKKRYELADLDAYGARLKAKKLKKSEETVKGGLYKKWRKESDRVIQKVGEIEDFKNMRKRQINVDLNGIEPTPLENLTTDKGLLEKVKTNHQLTHKEQRKLKKLQTLAKNPVAVHGGKDAGHTKSFSAMKMALKRRLKRNEAVRRQEKRGKAKKGKRY